MAFQALSEKSVGTSIFFIYCIDLSLNVKVLRMFSNDYSHVLEETCNSNQPNAAGPNTASLLVVVDNSTLILPL